MKIVNNAEISEDYFIKLKSDLTNIKTLGQVLSWASSKIKDDFLPHIVAEVVQQDEFTNDVIIPYKDLFLVFDTT